VGRWGKAGVTVVRCSCCPPCRDAHPPACAREGPLGYAASTSAAAGTRPRMKSAARSAIISVVA
jgi:hypothetical protein